MFLEYATGHTVTTSPNLFMLVGYKSCVNKNFMIKGF